MILIMFGGEVFFSKVVVVLKCSGNIVSFLRLKVKVSGGEFIKMLFGVIWSIFCVYLLVMIKRL